MKLNRLLKAWGVRTAATKKFLAVSCLAIATSAGLFGAGPGDQINVMTVNGAKGWTSVVPMKMNGDYLTDLLWYNVHTGQYAYSVATSNPGEQRVVTQGIGGAGWTSVVPMNINGDQLTDLLWYNAHTGQFAYSVATGEGVQQVVTQSIGGRLDIHCADEPRQRCFPADGSALVQRNDRRGVYIPVRDPQRQKFAARVSDIARLGDIPSCR